MKEEVRAKYCGNCGSHNVYDFPLQQFCSTRYGRNQDPIVNTLWRCKDWVPVGQDCYCVREALKETRRSMGKC